MTFSSSSRSSSEHDDSSNSQSRSRPSTPTRSLDAILPHWMPLPHRSRHKAHHIYSTSGLHPRTHAELAPATCSQKKVPIEIKEKFVTEGGVDVTKLLRASRASLLKTAKDAGANALVDEQWSCTICGPKNRSDGTYKTSVHYSACATRSRAPDPHQPIATDQARSVPGLMTILERVP